jgi:hypothetical protein
VGACIALALGLLMPEIVHACPKVAGFTDGGGDAPTVEALRTATADLDGATWIGKLAAVGHGRRDTIIHVPADLDRTRSIELVVFMDGYDSFAPRTMQARHAAAIAALAGRNAVYVAPDAPSSARGDGRSKRAYWKAGCAAKDCGGGHAAPGDFAALYRAVIEHVDHATCATSATWQLTLVGFSNGGRGVRDAVAQLAAKGSDLPLADIGLTRIVFADATYGHWLDDTWEHVSALPTLAELVVVLQRGDLPGRQDRAGRENRARVWKFARAELGAKTAPDGDAELVLDRVRIRRVALDHHGIGDVAVAHGVGDAAFASL